MADEPNRIAELLEGPDDNTRRFHRGRAPQVGIPTDPPPTEPEADALAAHMARIHAPEARPRFGVDEDGNPIEAPASGLVFNAETGALEVPKEDPLAGETAPTPSKTSTSTSGTSSSSSTSSS